MENKKIDPTQIKGWGIDADPKNDPTYPMRAPRLNVSQDPDYKHRPAALQPVDTEVLRSIERPNVSAVFGTPAPPKGLSGLIRRAAFHYSENRYRHWLPLIVADRVGVVEGIIEDLAKGHVPNIFAEKGYKASWKHDRAGLLTRLATIAAVATALVWWLAPKKRSRY